MMITILLTVRKKNGAHNHLSHLKRLRASKYSRHVVLCKYNKNQQTNTKKERGKKALVICLKILSGNNKFKEEKKTEHTIISRTSRDSEHQNIHVMFSYALIATFKKT